MKKTILLTLLLLALLVLPVEAGAKILPQAKRGAGASGTRYASSSTVIISAKLRADRRALTINFSNLQNANSVSYILTYQTNGVKEGATGTISTSEKSATRELLFGTCSGIVCRFHTGIANMKLEITSKLKSGKTSIKRYRIRV